MLHTKCHTIVVIAIYVDTNNNESTCKLFWKLEQPHLHEPLIRRLG